MIGETFAGKYTITRLLGQGAMGSVYEARHAGTGRRVAVKIIAAEHAADAQLLQRFELEARATGEVESQHIAQVLDVGVDPTKGTPFLVMELLMGEDLEQLLSRLGPLSPDLALRVIAQTCVGLEKAHAARIVHRDLKPANIFLAERDEGDRVVKLVDFGIAKITGADGRRKGASTRAGGIVGSPLYMSPEQARGAADVDHRSDIWSLGVVLYQLLSGRVPFDDNIPLGELIISICSTPAPSVLTAAPWVAPELGAIIERALRIPAQERYQSAGELLGALKPFLPQGTTIHASMLAPLDPSARASQPGGRPPAASNATVLMPETRASNPMPAPVSAPVAMPVLGSAPIAAANASSIASMTSSRVTAPGSARRSWILTGGLVTAGLAAAAFFALRAARPAGPGDDPSAHGAVSAVAIPLHAEAPTQAPAGPSAAVAPTQAPAGPSAASSATTPVVTPAEPPLPATPPSSGPSAASPTSRAAQPAHSAHATTAPKPHASAAATAKPAGPVDPFGGIRQ